MSCAIASASVSVRVCLLTRPDAFIQPPSCRDPALLKPGRKQAFLVLGRGRQRLASKAQAASSTVTTLFLCNLPPSLSESIACLCLNHVNSVSHPLCHPHRLSPI